MDALLQEEHRELINGEIYDMSPVSVKHSLIQGNLYRIIGSYLHHKRCHLFFEVEVRFDESNRLTPDLMVVCEPSQIKTTHVSGAPDFVVEVLSPSTHMRDVTIKKEIYEKFGVKEYWIISPKEESITVYILKDNKFVLDNVYHNFTEDEWAEMSPEEKEKQKLSLKISLYNDLEIEIRDIFEM